MPLAINLPLGLSVDLTFWVTLFSWPTIDIIKAIFALGAWTIFALILFYIASELWAGYRKSIKNADQEWSVLAIDIPEELVQSPKAVEQIFAHFSGVKESINVLDKYWNGTKQTNFSIEVISLEGYIQFLIRTEVRYRDLVEAAVYAQYPEAEITEVEDYIDRIPDHYPNEEFDIKGVEFKLERDETYPIRSYNEFETKISKDVVFNDPMAALLENFSRIGPGENLWMQIIVEPVDNSWKEKGIKMAKKIIEKQAIVDKMTDDSNVSGKVVNYIGDIPMRIAKEAFRVWNWNFESEEAAAEEKVGKLSDLTPGVRSTIEAIELKVAKIGFKTKIRVLYSAHKEAYLPGKSVEGLVGALNQFYDSSRNGLTKGSGADSKDNNGKKATKMVDYYKERKIGSGENPYILNIEELATIWHFPLAFVKTPLIQKIASKRAEPPTDLPLDEISGLPLEDLEDEPKPVEDEIITDSHGSVRTDLDQEYTKEETTATAGQATTEAEPTDNQDSKFDKNMNFG